MEAILVRKLICCLLLQHKPVLLSWERMGNQACFGVLLGAVVEFKVGSKLVAECACVSRPVCWAYAMSCCSHGLPSVHDPTTFKSEIYIFHQIGRCMTVSRTWSKNARFMLATQQTWRNSRPSRVQFVHSRQVCNAAPTHRWCSCGSRSWSLTQWSSWCWFSALMVLEIEKPNGPHCSTPRKGD